MILRINGQTKNLCLRGMRQSGGGFGGGRGVGWFGGACHVHAFIKKGGGWGDLVGPVMNMPS